MAEKVDSYLTLKAIQLLNPKAAVSVIDDPDNKGGTRNTDRGMELYADIEQELLRYFKIEL